MFWETFTGTLGIVSAIAVVYAIFAAVFVLIDYYNGN